MALNRYQKKLHAELIRWIRAEDKRHTVKSLREKTIDELDKIYSKIEREKPFSMADVPSDVQRICRHLRD